MRKLPPFPELIAFEAVARHRSFTQAAVELCLTQSAVSHRIRRLERHYRAMLIERLNPGIALTAQGGALLSELGSILDALAALGPHRERCLKVVAGSALCTWWLAGRLASFMRSHPGLSIELLPVRNEEQSIPEADIRILWVGESEEAATASQAPLFTEAVFPVCSPTLLPQPVHDPHKLNELPLLHKSAHGAAEWTWAMWRRRLGIGRATRRGELRFADMGLAMSAAVDGSGLALTRSLLAHDALRDGRLIVPCEGVQAMRSSKKHVVRWRRRQAEGPEIKAFVSWLQSEARSTLAAVNEMLSARPASLTRLA